MLFVRQMIFQLYRPLFPAWRGVLYIILHWDLIGVGKKVEIYIFLWNRQANSFASMKVSCWLWNIRNVVSALFALSAMKKEGDKMNKKLMKMLSFRPLTHSTNQQYDSTISRRYYVRVLPFRSKL